MSTTAQLMYVSLSPSLSLSLSVYLVFHSIPQLFDHYLTMLSAAGVFESKFHSATDLELGQSVMRVLLAALSHNDKEVSTVPVTYLEDSLPLLHSTM